ncbi:hypothetical protein GCM10010210_49220 [Pseudonocardia hydrocarbonoxydans]|uniref:Uncharacterized protein n=1 Tax=Pseudonocardia hydrocarbonoxydans TaxID=76726 RepID=A0A4Y3WTJ3_9PSEU|nr:hypothetical protein PHY01_44900 [Pseudonocardia hydrocarbonoxydans]
MAMSRKVRSPEARSELRDHLRDRLRYLEARLSARDGRVDPVFRRAYGLDRLDELAAGRDVLVHGYEIHAVLSTDDRARVDRLGFYVLTADGMLTRSDRIPGVR